VTQALEDLRVIDLTHALNGPFCTRGNVATDIFFDGDRWHFLDIFEEKFSRNTHRIHAYCLVKNHLSLPFR
jgi:hypothetical protein